MLKRNISSTAVVDPLMDVLRLYNVAFFHILSLFFFLRPFPRHSMPVLFRSLCGMLSRFLSSIPRHWMPVLCLFRRYSSGVPRVNQAAGCLLWGERGASSHRIGKSGFRLER